MEMAMTTLEQRIERAARAMAHENGDDFDAVPKNKTDWVKQRGKFGGRYRDINEPMQPDYSDMAFAALRAAVPELFTDPPTHWLAPIPTTDSDHRTTAGPTVTAYTSKDTALEDLAEMDSDLT